MSDKFEKRGKTEREAKNHGGTGDTEDESDGKTVLGTQ